MKRLLACVFFGALIASTANSYADQTVTAWGIPLGVTADQLRSAIGPPNSERTPHPMPSIQPALASLVGPLMGPRVTIEYWTYRRDGASINVTFSNGRTQTVSLMEPFTPTISEVDVSAPADPLGLHIGDGVGSLLVKVGAVKAIEPNSTLQIEQATIFATQGRLRYHFQIVAGRIQGEWISLF